MKTYGIVDADGVASWVNREFHGMQVGAATIPAGVEFDGKIALYNSVPPRHGRIQEKWLHRVIDELDAVNIWVIATGQAQCKNTREPSDWLAPDECLTVAIVTDAEGCGSDENERHYLHMLARDLWLDTLGVSF